MQKSCLIMSGCRLPPYINGPVQPLPKNIHAFVYGQPLLGFPHLPARQVLCRVKTTLRTGWICRSHFRRRCTDQTSCECELDNYGNVLLYFANGAIPMYIGIPSCPRGRRLQGWFCARMDATRSEHWKSTMFYFLVRERRWPCRIPRLWSRLSCADYYVNRYAVATGRVHLDAYR